MTTYEEVLARHEEDKRYREYMSFPRAEVAHDDRAWLLEELRRAVHLLEVADAAALERDGAEAAARAERADRLFKCAEEALLAAAKRGILGEVARENSRGAWEGWTETDVALEVEGLAVKREERMRERCAQEADAEVAAGEHMARTRSHQDAALAYRAAAACVAKRIRELR